MYFSAAFEHGGGTIVGTDEYKIGAGDYSAVVTKVTSVDPPPDVIFTPMFIPDSVVFLRQLRQAGSTIPVLSTDGNADAGAAGRGHEGDRRPHVQQLGVHRRGRPRRCRPSTTTTRPLREGPELLRRGDRLRRGQPRRAGDHRQAGSADPAALKDQLATRGLHGHLRPRRDGSDDPPREQTRGVDPDAGHDVHLPGRAALPELRARRRRGVTDAARRPSRTPLLAVDGLTVAYGSVLALRDVSLGGRLRGDRRGARPERRGEDDPAPHARGRAQAAVPARSGSTARRSSGWRPESVVRRGIALVPEGRHVFPKLTVEENLTIGGITRTDREELRADAQRWLERFPILGERSGTAGRHAVRRRAAAARDRPGA